MKKLISFSLVFILFLLNGCSIEVDEPTFYLPTEKVTAVEIQKEYYNEDGTTYYRKKIIKGDEQKDEICEMVRQFDGVRFANSETPVIDNFALVVILRGKTDHYLILNKEKGFYDGKAYKYTASDVYESFNAFYSKLAVDEVDTELEWG